jgi:hypothetical protein
VPPALGPRYSFLTVRNVVRGPCAGVTFRAAARSPSSHQKPCRLPHAAILSKGLPLTLLSLQQPIRRFFVRMPAHAAGKNSASSVLSHAHLNSSVC